MRALIRAEIVDPGGVLPSRDERETYDAMIVELFKNIGYDPRSLAGHCNPTQDELEQSKEVAVLFENLQGTIFDEEKKHLVLLGYTSAGQAMFVVCAINQTTLHIRV